VVDDNYDMGEGEGSRRGKEMIQIILSIRFE
jgi:hypothetical protein